MRSIPKQQEIRHVSQQDSCWKALYKLNHNWVMGQARVMRLSFNELLEQDRRVLDIEAGIGLGDDDDRIRTPHARIVQFKGAVLLAVSPCDMVHLWRIRSSVSAATEEANATGSNLCNKPLQFWQTYQCSRRNTTTATRHLRQGAHVTCLSLDTSTATGWQKVMVGLDSGHFSVFEYPLLNGVDQTGSSDTATLREIGRTDSLQSWTSVGGIRSAAFQYPILTTCTDGGVISIYKIMAEQDSSPRSSTPWCTLLHRLYGVDTGSPVQVELERVRTPVDEKRSDPERACWRALVSFGLELHDGSWTVRLQEIEFDDHSILQSTETGTAGEEEDDTLYENSGQDEGYDSPFPSFSQATLSEATCQPTVGHGRIGAISALSIAWPLVVTTHSDNTMNVFQMTRDFNVKDSAGQPLAQPRHDHRQRIRFRHLSTLYGHCGAVSSVSIESQSGRLVSASMDRSIKVWTMAIKNRQERIEQQRVHRCTVSMSDINNSWTESGRVTKEEGLGLIWVGSDEEKIVSMNCDGTIKVWQFS
ncbi:RNA-dependent ATPase rok1 [Mortierella alpina]|nr:RNA-dependent ATPase rok1 [Mortierella alpina]